MSRDLLSFTKIPDGFQKELFGKISKEIKSNQPLQLYGAPGSGNTLIAKALIQSDSIRKSYFGEDYKFVLLDGNTLLERTPLGLSNLFYYILVNQGGDITRQADLQSKIEEVVVKICSQSKLVLIMDHMQELAFSELEPFFRNLYSIYRKLEPKLNFLFITTGFFGNNLSVFGPMARLMEVNKIKTNPFNRSDSMWFIGEKEKQLGIRLGKDEKDKIITISGGFPRTIKRLTELASGKYEISEIEENPGLDPMLAMHFDELEDFTEILPEIPIFKKYLETKNRTLKSENIGGIVFGKRLTKNEEKLLKLFSKNKGSIVGREAGIGYLWGENAVEISDHAYDQLILRLRKKLKLSAPQGEIETIRGRGHILR